MRHTLETQDPRQADPPTEPETAPGTAVAIGSAGDEAAARDEVPAILPVLPLKNTVLFPHLLSPLLVSSPRSKQLIEEVLVSPQRLLVCVAVRNAVDGSPGAGDVHRFGTLMRVAKMVKFPDDTYRLLVQGVARAEITEFTAEDPFLRGRVRVLEETGDLASVETLALMRNVAQQFVSLVSESPRLSDELQVLVANTEHPSKLADLAGSSLDFDVAGKQELIEELDVPRRLRRVLEQIGREHDAVKVESEIREKVQSDIGKSQRDYVLRQQLEAIRQELGETEDSESETQRLEQRIAAAGMPEEAEKQARRELERLAQMPTAAAEHAVIRSYLEWLVELPWSKTSQDRLDVEEARRILDVDHYGLDKVKERIVEYIAVLSLKRDLKGPILCFVGPPGTGKTSLGRSIAHALGREFQRISLGGVHDEAEIRGHRRTYVGALPGRIIQSLRRAGTRNPVFMLDEVDKVGGDFRGDPSSALLEVLDPAQNSTFSDHYLEVPFDLSQVLFVATANLMDPVPAALRDRMEVIELPGYIEEEKLEIAKRFLVPRQRVQNGVDKIEFEITDDALRVLIRSYTREAGVRNLEREIATLARKVARRIAEEGVSGPQRIGPEDLPALLGPVKVEPEVAERVGQPGVAAGLAWTPAGGDILFIESTRMPGKGELKLTGSLGDVMRESAEAARSWLHAHASELQLDSELFAKSDLHLHVPSGGVPKDGPSAGVAMVTSLASLLTGRPADPRVAMTGEITLRGKVLPVGGIKEKVLAAKRAGIERVVLPERNRRDIEEVPKELLAGLDLQYVGMIDEALRYTLAPPR
jgi:ATP-dependent Lon protease